MQIRIIIGFIVLAAISRILPHPPNFTPIAAMGLFGAAYLDRRWMAYAVPFAALFLSDLVLNNTIYAGLYDGFRWISSPWIYLAFALVILLGRVLLESKARPARVLAASVAGSLVFYLVTNYFAWFDSRFLYPQNGAGLLNSYIAGLPFLGNTLLGDLFFSGVLFGGFYFVQRRLKLEKAA